MSLAPRKLLASSDEEELVSGVPPFVNVKSIFMITSISCWFCVFLSVVYHSLSLSLDLRAIDRFIRVSNVEEKVFFVVFLIEAAHGCRGGGNDIVDKEEEGVLGSKLDSLSDQEVKLADGQIGGNEVLLLVQLGDPSLGSFLHNDGNAVGILPTDLFALGAALLEGVLLLVLPLHCVCVVSFSGKRLNFGSRGFRVK